MPDNVAPTRNHPETTSTQRYHEFYSQSPTVRARRLERTIVTGATLAAVVFSTLAAAPPETVENVPVVRDVSKFIQGVITEL